MSLTTRRLVRMVGDSGFYANVDTIRLQRLARELLNYIEANVIPCEDEYGIRTWLVPMCEEVLDGTIKLPVAYLDLPLSYPMRERLLPLDLEKIFSEFRMTACGMALEISEKILIGGVVYMYADVEE